MNDAEKGLVNSPSKYPIVIYTWGESGAFIFLHTNTKLLYWGSM